MDLSKYISIYDEIFKNKDSKRIELSFNEKEKLLFEGLAGNNSEFSISKKLYNSSPSHQSFQSLKKGLLEKFIHMIMFVNTGSSFQINKSKILRNILAVKLLELFSQRDLMVSLCKKTLNKCLKFHFHFESIDLARLLSTHYGMYEQDLILSTKYDNIVSHSLEVYKNELLAEKEYSRLISHYATKDFKSYKDAFKASADHIGTLLNCNSSRLYFFYYMLRYAQYYAAEDIVNREKICKEAIEYFSSLNFNHDLAKNVFVFYLVNIYLENGQLAKAELIIKSFLADTSHKSQQYYRFKELLFRVYLYQGRTEEVNELYNYLKANLKKMEFVFTKDRLLIYSIYKSLLNNEKINFRLINYNLNRVKQDKKGLHIPLLIGQVCYAFINEPDKLIDKIESLEQYSYRYLTEEKHLRTKKFIKILIAKLSSKDVGMAGISELHPDVGSNSLEMIEYEKLLNLTLRLAEKKRNKKLEKVFS